MALINSFNKTNFDLERGNKINIPYQSMIGGQPKSFSTTHPYTPNSTYLNMIRSQGKNT
tara:strand:+ start:1653 stop:1829 length:177 start_codon:yes stop_codon:yes gene_type:complete